MRLVLFGVGILLVLMGLLFIGQGTGVFPYPSYSFMISDMSWAYRGMAIAAAGIGLVLIARRMGR
jgi:hypothetical protein